MAEIGTKGVLALISESTNAERPGSNTFGRQWWAAILEEAFMKAKVKLLFLLLLQM